MQENDSLNGNKSLFESDLAGLARQHERVDDKLALLPKSIRRGPQAVKDVF